MRRATLTGAAALAALALTAGCDDSVTYSYFLVDVKLDPITVNMDLLDVIEACAVTAETPVRMESADLGCRRRQVRHDLGKFEYTTTLTTGSIKFVAIANDFTQKTVARGEVGPLPIQVGKTVEASLLMTAVPMPTDGGAPDSAPTPADTAAGQ